MDEIDRDIRAFHQERAKLASLGVSFSYSICSGDGGLPNSFRKYVSANSSKITLSLTNSA
jgi:hypothetical protein